jgi:capsular polysaccharide export protein
MLLVASKGMYSIPNIEIFLDSPVSLLLSKIKRGESAVAGWGRRPSFYKAKAYAQTHHVPLLTVEDGFIRSIGLGVNGSQPLSLIKDDIGVYFDAFNPSRLEALITTGDEQAERAQQLIQLIKQHDISKYNNSPVIHLNINQKTPNILIVDQTAGDQSIQSAGADQKSFLRMLNQAIKAHPHATLWIKTHPDVLTGKKRGHFDPAIDYGDNIKFIAQACNPIALLKQMDEVYIVSSQMGFEALMLDKKVHCFGVPWYAGWGLTDDSMAPTHILQARRGVQRTIEQLVSAAYFDYAIYVDPVIHKKCDVERIVEIIVQQKYWDEQLEGEVVALGFSRWKRKFIRTYLKQASNTVTFKWLYPSKAKNNESYIFWGSKRPDKRQKLQTSQSAKIWRMEDGFIRSNGLGANLIAPLSLVLDDQGIYYDAGQPSRLESILNHIKLDSQQVKRAEHLQALLVERKISKYNVGELEQWPKSDRPREVILVPGQVEDDASVRLGGEGIFTNLDLLKAVRANKPDAWIVYKPHPDVEAGLRPGKIATEVIQQFANAMIHHLDMPSCLAQVDAVHTLTSLTGFEALLRGKEVWCYGMPFYAGWGLTIDRTVCLRRKRVLTVTELVYAVLIEYPLYKLPQSGEYLATPEQACEYLVNERHKLLQNKLSLVARVRSFIIYKR